MAYLAIALQLVFSGTHHHGRTPSCPSNLKQVGLAFAMYCQDYDDHFPPARQWTDSTYPYTKNYLVFQCPMELPDHPAFMYAYNSASSKRTLTAITDPSNWPLAFDSNSTERNTVSNGFSSIASPPHHIDGNYILFADFHVKHRKPVPHAGITNSPDPRALSK